MNEPTAQQEFAASSGDRDSQVERLRSAFHEAGVGTWVPMPQLARVMSPNDDGVGNCPPRRIFDLKKQIEKDGFTIKNRKEWVDGVCHSFYRIIRTEPESSNESARPSAPNVDRCDQDVPPHVQPGADANRPLLDSGSSNSAFIRPHEHEQNPS